MAASSLEARAAARRAALIEAGIELLGTQGAAGVTVRAVCREARLTERYFYESFADGGRDALLVAVHDEVARQAREAIVAAVASHQGDSHQGDEESLAYAAVAAGFRGRAREESLAYSAVAAFTAFLEEDPRRGRVLVSESFHESVLARHDIDLVPAFAALLVAQITALPDAPDAADAELTAVALLGALRALYLTWLRDPAATSSARLNAHAARLVIAAARVTSRDVRD
jgi:AcrR family transcriptional regulator